MDARLKNGNWAEVFGEPGEYSGPQYALKPEAIPGYDGSLAAFTRADVAEVVALWQDHDDDDTEWSGYVVVRLADGRWASLEGGCDYTGWG